MLPWLPPWRRTPIRTDWRHLDQWNAVDPAKIVIPTLLIQGESDPFAPTAMQAAFFSRLKTADREWIVLAGGDHAWEEQESVLSLDSSATQIINECVYNST